MKKNINELNKEMRLNKLSLNEYIKFKKSINELGANMDLGLKKTKTQKKQIRNLYDSLNIPENLKTLFLSNLYIYDDEAFICYIEEAKAYGCKKEDYSKYLKLNHNIDETIYEFKLNEIDTYMNFYSMTYLSDRIKNIVKETKKAVMPIDNISYIYEDINEKEIKGYYKEIA